VADRISRPILSIESVVVSGPSRMSSIGMHSAKHIVRGWTLEASARVYRATHDVACEYGPGHTN